MSDSQTNASAPETGLTDEKYAAQSLRFTPLRSYAIARTLSRGIDRERAQSPIVPAQRFRYSA